MANTKKWGDYTPRTPARTDRVLTLRPSDPAATQDGTSLLDGFFSPLKVPVITAPVGTPISGEVWEYWTTISGKIVKIAKFSDGSTVQIAAQP